MKYNDAMKYITEVGNFGSNYGLERTEKLLEFLGNPHKKLKLIHIAGTNGKGSTTSMITKLLRGKGFKVGMYTSPFLEEFEERIQIDGENIPKETLGNLMDDIKVAVDKVIECGYNHPTEFEIITCLMFYYFHKENVDFGVIEVGLGGRLDSTNVIEPILTIITSISLDHVNILGNTLGEIAGEKAGILKKNTPLILYPQKEEANKVIVEKAEKLGIKIYRVKEEDCKLVKVIKGENPAQLIEVKGEKDTYKVELPLLGEHQILNCALAIKGFETLSHLGYFKFEKEEVNRYLRDVKWIGRLEVMNKSPLVVIDGAHNIDGIKRLKENVEKYFEYKNLHLIIGILADKQVGEMIETIAPQAFKIYTLSPHSERAELSEDLKNEVLKVNKNVESFEDYEEALNIALENADKDDLILVTGSLYMIGDMRKIIRLKTYKYKNI